MFTNWLETKNSSSTTSREKFTHKEVKKSYQFENYPKTVTNPAQRISLTRLRLGCHALQIQTGKYEDKGASIPLEEWTCLVCKENCVEREQHFLMYYHGYAAIRVGLHSPISNKYAVYANLLRADNRVTSKIIDKYINLIKKKKKRKEILI